MTLSKHFEELYSAPDKKGVVFKALFDCEPKVVQCCKTVVTGCWCDHGMLGAVLYWLYLMWCLTFGPDKRLLQLIEKQCSAAD